MSNLPAHLVFVNLLVRLLIFLTSLLEGLVVTAAGIRVCRIGESLLILFAGLLDVFTIARADRVTVGICGRQDRRRREFVLGRRRRCGDRRGSGGRGGRSSLVVRVVCSLKRSVWKA